MYSVYLGYYDFPVDKSQVRLFNSINERNDYFLSNFILTDNLVNIDLNSVDRIDINVTLPNDYINTFNLYNYAYITNGDINYFYDIVSLRLINGNVARLLGNIDCFQTYHYFINYIPCIIDKAFPKIKSTKFTNYTYPSTDLTSKIWNDDNYPYEASLVKEQGKLWYIVESFRLVDFNKIISIEEEINQDTWIYVFVDPKFAKNPIGDEDFNTKQDGFNLPYAVIAFSLRGINISSVGRNINILEFNKFIKNYQAYIFDIKVSPIPPVDKDSILWQSVIATPSNLNYKLNVTDYTFYENVTGSEYSAYSEQYFQLCYSNTGIQNFIFIRELPSKIYMKLQGEYVINQKSFNATTMRGEDTSYLLLPETTQDRLKMFKYPYSYYRISDNNGSDNYGLLELQNRCIFKITENMAPSMTRLYARLHDYSPVNTGLISDEYLYNFYKENNLTGFLSMKDSSIGYNSERFAEFIANNKNAYVTGLALPIGSSIGTAFGGYTDKRGLGYVGRQRLTNSVSTAANFYFNIDNLKSSPQSLKNGSNDVSFSRQVFNNNFYYERYELQPIHIKTLEMLYKTEGYAVNDIDYPSNYFNNREKYDYVKCFIESIDARIPQFAKNFIVSMFARGVKLCHVDTINYLEENKEV